MNKILDQGFIDTLQEYKDNGINADYVWNRDTLSTCRYNTHIDYILVNNSFLNLFEILDYQHLSCNKLSDHKMVKATFKLKQKVSVT